MPVNTSSNYTDHTTCGLQMLDSGSHHYALNVAIIVINTPFVIFAVISNLIVVITVYRCRELQIPANILLCSLACTDLMVGLVTQPLFIAWRVMLHYQSTLCRSELIHSVYETFLFVCTGGSFLCLAYISTDRLMAVSRPLSYRAGVTANRTILNLVILWIIWLGFIIIRYSGIEEETNNMITSAVAGILLVYLLVVQFVLMVSIKRSSVHVLQAQGNNVLLIYNREKRCAITILYIFLALVILLVPAVVVQIILGFTKANQSRTEMNFAISALLINSSVNPFIYFWRNGDLRKAARLLFKGNKVSEEGNSSGNSGRSLEEAL